MRKENLTLQVLCAHVYVCMYVRTAVDSDDKRSAF